MKEMQSKRRKNVEMGNVIKIIPKKDKYDNTKSMIKN